MAEAQTYRQKDRIEAADDELPGVPTGTGGTVIEVTGLSWIRYRVDFDNGRQYNLIDAHHLRPRAATR